MFAACFVLIWHPTVDLLKKEEKRGFAFPRKRGFEMKKEEKQRDLIFCLQKHKEHLQWSEIL
jgi:hypothetical protein